MRFLICPGMARGGTTFLWRQIAKNDAIFNISKDQELRYLARKNADLDGYLQRFRTADASRIFFDVSPIYLFKTPQVMENIKRVLASHEVFFNLNIRSPMDHAYSLYLHRIRGHVARLGHGKSALVGKDLYEAGAVNQFIFDSTEYFLRRPLRIADFVESILNNFGRDAMTFIDFNKEFGTPAPVAKLEKMLGVRLEPFDYSQTTNRGGNKLPTYIYGGEEGMTFEAGDMVYKIEPRTLLLVGGRNSTRSWPNVDPLRAAQVMNGANLWTTFVPKERVQELFERHFEKEWRRLSDLLEYDFLSSVQHKDFITYKSMPLRYVERVAGVSIDNAF